MSRVIPFNRPAVALGTPTERGCAHRNLKLVENGEIVNCSDCLATISSFRALMMLSEQYALAIKQIERLTARIRLADARILELSQELDRTGKRHPIQPSSDA